MVQDEISWNLRLNSRGFLIEVNISRVPPVPMMVMMPNPNSLPQILWSPLTVST